MPPEVSRWVTKNIKVIVRSAAESDGLDSPLYAVNWFSTRRAWMYNLYLSLAVTQVKTVGAFPVFKAFVGETLAGKPEMAREQLLIVRYPNAEAFVTLAGKALFKIISILRINSVKDFTFNFTEKITHEARPADLKARSHLVHLFTGDQEGLNRYREMVAGGPVKLTYLGYMKAQLLAQLEEKKPREVPYLMNAIAILEADDEPTIRAFVDDPDVQTLREGFRNNYLAWLDRVL